jgi:hypothetical protein
MTILEENLHNFQVVEHDPMLYEDAGHMGVHGPGPKTTREATILLYAPALDP